MFSINILVSYKGSEDEKGQNENNFFLNEIFGYGELQTWYFWFKGSYNLYDFRLSCNIDGKLGENKLIKEKLRQFKGNDSI